MTTENLLEADVPEKFKGAKIWRAQDTTFIAKVTEGFRDLYGKG